jgi:hypothetical protein
MALASAKEGARRHAARVRGAGSRQRAPRGQEPPVLIGQAFAELIEKTTGLSSTQLAVRAAWQNVSGDLAWRVTIGSFDERTRVLELRTDSKAWTTQMRLIAPQALIHLNEELKASGIDPVRRLVVIQASRKELPPLLPPLAQAAELAPNPAPQAAESQTTPSTEAGDPEIAAAVARQVQQAPARHICTALPGRRGYRRPARCPGRPS